MRVLGMLVPLAAAAWAGVGSVISSFKVNSYPGNRPFSLYRDAEYVHIFYHMVSHVEVRVYTPQGGCVAGGSLNGYNWLPEDGDPSFLGEGYYTIGAEGALCTYTTNGSFVRLDHGELNEVLGYGHVPGSPYYYVGAVPGDTPPGLAGVLPFSGSRRPGVLWVIFHRERA